MIRGEGEKNKRDFLVYNTYLNVINFQVYNLHVIGINMNEILVNDFYLCR
jgi:hypothetical protein